MKLFKKLSILSFIILVCLTFDICKPTVSADNVENDYYQELEKTQTNLYREVVYSHIIAQTKTTKPVGNDHGLGGNTPIDPNKWYGQQINIVDIPRGQNAMVIPWSVQSELQWELTSIASMAYDYERKHPGYKVIAAINGDFYDWHSTYEYPNSGTGIEAHEGDLIRYVDYSDAVAIQNGDFTTDQLIFAREREMTRTATPHLAIYDAEGNVIYDEPVDKVNAALNDGEVGVIFGSIHNVYSYDENGNPIFNAYDEHAIERRDYKAPTIYDGNAFLIKNGSKVITQTSENSFYGKGVITSANKELTVEDFDKTTFAIICKNPEVAALLAENVTVRVQYEFTGILEGQQNVIGVYRSMLENGVVTPDHADSYYTTRAPRSIIASKADGTIGLITIDGRQGPKNMYGANQEEMTNILQLYGYSNAYLLDGGGSSSFIVRNGDRFDIVNSPSDGHIRNVANGLFVVVKEEAYKVASIDSTENSLTFNISTEGVDFTDVKAIKVTLGDVTKEVVDGKVTFDNLTINTTYDYYLSHDSFEKNDLRSTVYGTVATNKIVPSIGEISFTEDEEKVYLKININDPHGSISNVVIRVGNRAFPLYDGEAVIPKNLVNENGTLEYRVSIRYILSDTTAPVYLNEDKVLALYNIVSFDYNLGEGYSPYVVKYQSGQKVEKIPTPAAEGKVFKYWALNGQEYNFDQPLSESITLVAVWEDAPQQSGGSGCAFGAVYSTLSILSAVCLAVLALRRKH